MRSRVEIYTDLFDEHGPNDLVGNYAPIPDRRVKLFHGLIQASPIPAQLDKWQREARKSNAGRKATLSATALITVLCLLAADDEALHIERAARIFQRRLRPDARSSSASTTSPAPNPNGNTGPTAP